MLLKRWCNTAFFSNIFIEIAEKAFLAHENEYWQHLQQQGDGAGIPCVASPEKGQNVPKGDHSY